MKAFCFLVLVLFFSCSDASHKDVKTDNEEQRRDTTSTSDTIVKTTNVANLETRILDTLAKLSFVKKSDHYIDSISNHKHGIAFLLDSSDANEIFVKAGYDGPERFESYYQFYINPKTFEIKVYDVVNDEKLSIKEFEAKQSK